MIRICETATLDRVALHQQNPPRIYARTQWNRVFKTRIFVKEAIRLCGGHPILFEIGCAALDISGKYSSRATVIGVDCNTGYIPIVKEKHPDCGFILHDVETFVPDKVDILVMCEILEHIVDPKGLTRRLMPMAKYAVISHPIDDQLSLNEPRTDHYWSFNGDDFNSWFYDNNYTIVLVRNLMTFRNGGGFHHRLAIGRNNAKS